MSQRWRRWVGASASIALIATLSIAGLVPASAQTEIRVLDREGPYEKDLDLGKRGFGAGDEPPPRGRCKRRLRGRPRLQATGGSSDPLAR